MAVDTRHFASSGISAPSLELGRSSYVELCKRYEELRGHSQLVILQGTPDPDAISSAVALEAIGSLYDISTTILCFSQVSHHENRALVKRLGIRLVRYDETFDISSYSVYCIVDSQRWETPIDEVLKVNDVHFLGFFDHHREDTSAPPPAELVDIRPHYGSTASILAEYLQAAFPRGLEVSEPTHVRLATALMHGVRADTKKFLLATRAEYQAALFLSTAADHQVIEAIERKTLSSSTLGILQNALVNRRVHDNFIFTDVGHVRSIDRDGIPQAADLLLHREGTDTVLVWGMIDEQIIDGSLRTRSETINPDEFLKGFLGVSAENGRYYGGGTLRDRGGFQIPLGFLCMHQDKSQLYGIAKEIIEKSFLEYLGKTNKSS